MLLLISVDDGHPLDWKVFELLKKYDLLEFAVFYIAPENTKNEVMSHTDIKKLSESCEIGGHALTHTVLTKLGTNEQITEIMSGKNILESIIGRKISSFAPPRGWYNEEVTNNVKACGFKNMRTMKQGATYIKKGDFIIPVTVHFHPFHYETWIDLLPVSLDSESAKTEGLFSVTCHGWELEKFQLWNEFENMLEELEKHKQYAHPLPRS